MKTTSHNKGFTLIELSIVLVIIGLIVGGVLVGQDLIKAAQIRATVSQLEKFDAAANTFRLKYNGIPGDIQNASNYLTATTGLTGDGDRLVEGTANDGTSFDNEAAAFFRHLALAGLIGENIAEDDVTTAEVDAITSYVPAGKISNSLILVRATGGVNHYIIGKPTVTDGVLTFTAGDEMKVIDAFQIDGKLDDGLPSTGRVVAVDDIATADDGASGATANECVDTTGSDLYQMSTTAISNDTECTLRVRASF